MDATRAQDREPGTGGAPEEFPLGEGGTIAVGQLLKVTGLCDSGGEAKHLVQAGGVRVNGEVELHRGRTLRAGDVVVTRGRTIRLTS